MMANESEKKTVNEIINPNYENLPKLLSDAVMASSESMPKDTPQVKGCDFESGITLDSLLHGLRYSGFQATNVGKAIEEVRKMIQWRPNAEQRKKYIEDEMAEEEINALRCRIFFGFTSNQISSGNREVIKYLCKHNMVDCIVTTGGGIEEDIMKCMNPHYHGDFALRGRELRPKGINRIGNLLVPNHNYVEFEAWLSPILKQMLLEQKEKGTIWTPSKMIRRFGKVIDNEDSVWYWCYKNNIPVFCPAITDGAVGDVLFFRSFSEPGLIVDIARDICYLNLLALRSECSGMIILGGGVVKHHICNANLMRNGAEFSLFVNTGQEFDGSDSGARPDEAISWGKIRLDAHPVKVYGEATIMFPLIVAGSFAKLEKEARKAPRPVHFEEEEHELKSLLTE